jgi:hypothetical protein
MNNMSGRYLLSKHGSPIEHDIFADKSALVLEWLLLEGVSRDEFSLREVSAAKKVSLGLVQRVFQSLVQHGHLATTGIRTAKSFRMKRPERLLRSWLESYSVVKKCRMWTYRSGLGDIEEVRKILAGASFGSEVIFSLHSAAREYKLQNTNLQTIELYLMDAEVRPVLEKKLLLEPQERGYEVLLMKPYYKRMIQTAVQNPGASLSCSPMLLTFLDLYHFPLRGQEQAEFMAERIPKLKRIYKKG